MRKVKPTFSKLRASYKYKNNTCTRINRIGSLQCQQYVYNTANTFTQNRYMANNCTSNKQYT